MSIATRCKMNYHTYYFHHFNPFKNKSQLSKCKTVLWGSTIGEVAFFSEKYYILVPIFLL